MYMVKVAQVLKKANYPVDPNKLKFKKSLRSKLQAHI